MKKTFKYLFTITFSIGFLASCLDDKGYTDIINSNSNAPVVSLGLDYLGLYPVAVPISTSENINVTVTAARAKADVTGTFIVDPAALTAYNAADLAAYKVANPEDVTLAKYQAFVLLPANAYTIPSLTVAIPEGALDVDLNIKVNSSLLSLTAKYILPLTLQSISGDESAVLASNLSQVLLYVQVKNKWDGAYSIATKDASYLDIPNSATFTGSYPKTIYLKTLSANQVGYFDPNLNGGIYGYRFLNAGSGSYYGNWAAIFTFSGSDVTAVTNYYGQGTNSSTRAGKIDPTGKNKITYKADGSVESIEVSYIMVQAGADRAKFSEKLVFTGARP